MILRFTDEELMEGLRQKKDCCIGFMYHEFGPLIRSFIRYNSGNIQDVEDILHDTLLVMFKRASQPHFKLNCSLKTYFVAISKNLWLQRLDRKYKLKFQADYEVHEPPGTYEEEQDLKEEDLEQNRLFLKHLSALPYECRRILELYCLKVPYREIARLLDYKDEVYVKTRKYSCKNLLRKRIMNDPDYQQFLDYEGNRNFDQMD